MTIEQAWSWLSRSHLRTALGAVVGAGAAAAYAHFVGCRTGTCPLTSSVWSAGAFGLVVGSVAGWPAKASPPAGAGGDGR